MHPPAQGRAWSPFDEHRRAEQTRDLEEHWRLLYVGMTRASERLVIAGVEPSARRPGEQLAQARRARARRRLARHGRRRRWGSVVRYSRRGRRRGRPSPSAARLVASRPVPDWARRAGAGRSRPPRPLAPSAIAADDAASPPPSDGDARRGAARDLDPPFARAPCRRSRADQRRAAAARAGSSGRRAWPTPARAIEIADQVCGILSDARFRRLFGPGSLAEAPLAATLPDGRVIAGTVDRLLVEDERVSVIDFKTGRVPAERRADPGLPPRPDAGLCEALGVIFPGRRGARGACSTRPARGCSNSALERRADSAHMTSA